MHYLKFLRFSFLIIRTSSSLLNSCHNVNIVSCLLNLRRENVGISNFRACGYVETHQVIFAYSHK